jgi:NADPH:quinone reductase-like Zn-dependent oxidoreductase
VPAAPRLDYVSALGADHVIDYAKQDFTESGESYDLIFDVLGKSGFARCRNSLAPAGLYLPASFKTKALLQMLRTNVTGGQRVLCALASEEPETLIFLRELIEAGKYQSIVDRCYPMEQAAEAHRYAESGAKTGCVAISVSPSATRQQWSTSLNLSDASAHGTRAESAPAPSAY